MARKPLDQSGTVAANVLKWGTGAINVDGCRVATDDGYQDNAVTQGINTAQTSYAPAVVRRTFEPAKNGRWPANIILDGSEEVVAAFPESKAAYGNADTARAASGKLYDGNAGREIYGKFAKEFKLGTMYADCGSAARFFYTAKADADDRLGSKHPTVKPVDLMQYLVRLVTPPGGVVLDPFAGHRHDRRSCLARRHAGGADRARGRVSSRHSPAHGARKIGSERTRGKNRGK